MACYHKVHNAIDRMLPWVFGKTRVRTKNRSGNGIDELYLTYKYNLFQKASLGLASIIASEQ